MEIRDILNDMDRDDLVQLHNEYTEYNNNLDDQIYSMNEFEELVAMDRPFMEVYSQLNSDFDINDEYFWYDGYANISTGDADKAINEKVDYSSIESWIEDDPTVVERYDDFEDWLEEQENDIDIDIDEDEE